MDWLGLKDKVAVVTGGAAGIGRACSLGLAEVGVHVVVADMNEEGGKKTVKELEESFGGTHLFVKLNVADKNSVDSMISKTLETFGSIDILLNNAGINMPRLIIDPAGKEEITEDVWDKIVAVNQKGVFLCTQAAARQMQKSGKGGVIINMASEAGVEGSEGQSVYAGTKGAVYALTRSWAKELGKHGIRVVGIAPGILEATPLRSEAYEKALAYTRGISVEALRAGYEKVSIPIGRTGKLKEVADLVCFLASERSCYIHGTTINITGGKSRG
jgi:sorbitol-6-phosphate 2-dehydrogenase